MAIATCSGVNDLDAPALVAALAQLGIESELCVWDDATVAWDQYDLVVIRSTWDYTTRLAEFLAWAQSLPRLVNPYEVIEYSSDKHYLLDLERRGHRIVPSAFFDMGSMPAFPDAGFVVKPAVGAGSSDAERYSRFDLDRALLHVATLHAQGRDVLVQPYVHSVDERGERALVFIDGELSHAMTKRAMLNVSGDERDVSFRIQQMEVGVAEPDALALAESVLAEGGYDDLAYARVDMVHTDAGWAIMELELVEPWLYLGYDTEAPGRLARALARRL